MILDELRNVLVDSPVAQVKSVQEEMRLQARRQRDRRADGQGETYIQYPKL